MALTAAAVSNRKPESIGSELNSAFQIRLACEKSQRRGSRQRCQRSLALLEARQRGVVSVNHNYVPKECVEAQHTGRHGQE